ncbi:hypothetical protein AQJ23_44780 [Streptomyces antibioticus]|nr:hypothetical protein [Streptomyces antibioticus]KUN16513.1 hypothetical protein AQJ23_44780 [Streptomyces antibioticus]
MSETTSTPAESQENEATAEEYTTHELAGTPLRVRPMGKWRPSYLKALRNGDFEGWAAGALHEDDAEKFVEIDATFDEIGEFTAAVMQSSGEAPGKSGARSARSKTTRKR